MVGLDRQETDLESAPNDVTQSPSPSASTTTEWKRILVDLVETVVLAFVLFLIINTVSARVRVDGQSMLPTLNNGEFVLVNRLAYKLGQPARGDIIVFRSTTQLDLDLIKRIIGVPGDEVSVADGHVHRQRRYPERALHQRGAALQRRVERSGRLPLRPG